ncbi:signal peptidase II [Rhizorhapis sp.]|uniref:signal peptidase II n=1 Tax=Rhizorhapis sp. TaxID=1968842 RepID=UPI002B47CB83|nr:signal peptidase II [Rhizorhapis sp.]HKR17067.1 signal peptidase II [Rhizorhapis sp.]
MAIRKNHRKLGVAAAATIFILDQIIKYIVVYPLALESRQVIDLLPFFDLNFVRNYGVSMGFFRADSETMRWLLVGMTAAIAVFVALWMWREKARDDVIALGLVLGGALGNIVDRVRFGYVVDFADFHIGSWRPFLIFNLADAAITIGVLILLARALLLRDKGGKVEKRNA